MISILVGEMTSKSDVQEAGLFKQIREMLTALSPAERRVARTVLSGHPAAALGPSSQLAALAGVSGPTVSRFASKLGYGSYREFQMALKKEALARTRSPVDAYRERVDQFSERPNTAPGLQLGYLVEHSIQSLPAADLSRSAEYLADPRRQIFTIGGWFTHLAAGYMASVLHGFRSHVRLVPATSEGRTSAMVDIASRDVVVAFDFRRYELDTQEFARCATMAGAQLVLVTDPWLSPLADLADAIIPAESVGPAPFESLAPTVAVVEALLAAAINNLGDSGYRRFEKFGSIADSWLHPSLPGTEAEGEGRQTRPARPSAAAVDVSMRKRRALSRH